MQYERSKADPCLYYKWQVDPKDLKKKLVIWLLWVDDNLITGPVDAVSRAKQKMMSLFDCDDLGEMKEYVGCKVERNWKEQWIKLTQPVLLQSFMDEFPLDTHRPNPRTPAEAGDNLS